MKVLLIILILVIFQLISWIIELKKTNKELRRETELAFDGEQELMNKGEKLYKALQDSNYVMYQFNSEKAISDRMKLNHKILAENNPII